MSGGTFDYIQYRIDDAVREIEDRIRRNNKTILENWNEISEEERNHLWEYERVWTPNQHPCWVEDEAQKTADKALNIRKTAYWKSARGTSDGILFNDLTERQKKEWNKIYQESIQKLIEDHNSSPIGSGYSTETIAKIQEMLMTIKKAKIYLDRIDWLFAGDDGEDSFLKRTEDELKEEGLE